VFKAGCGRGKRGCHKAEKEVTAGSEPLATRITHKGGKGKKKSYWSVGDWVHWTKKQLKIIQTSV